MTENPAPAPPNDSDTHEFYGRVAHVLNQAGISFLLGGGFALEFHTGVSRSTKDLDLFVKRSDLERLFEGTEAAGFRTELTFHHWLGKIFSGDDFIDVIFSSRNTIATVDDAWFEYAVRGSVFGMKVNLCPAEEMIWSKAFIMERERYDGADIAHLFLARAEHLDWTRLLQRFGDHWRVLLSHLVLFGFIYPGDNAMIPTWLMLELLSRLQGELGSSLREKLCRGTILSGTQYRIDIERWGYQDVLED
jgi:hypothetical protein